MRNRKKGKSIMGGVSWKMKNDMKEGKREHCRKGEHYGVVRRCGGRRASWTGVAA